MEPILGGGRRSYFYSTVYELVNKQTKFTVVYIRLRPEIRLRVRLPVRLLKNVAIGLPEAPLPNTSVEVRLLKVYLPKVYQNY